MGTNRFALHSWTLDSTPLPEVLRIAREAANYGMNFQFMPELGASWGYAWALGLMVAVGVALAVAFRRIDWL